MISYSHRKTIKLNKLDAAIILTEDGSVEATLPEIDTDNVPENVLLGAAVVFALSNPELCEIIRTNFLKLCPQSVFSNASNDDD